MSLPLSILFLGSKPVGYRCLQHLLEAAPSLGARVDGVLTQPRKEFDGESDLIALAAAHNIPVLEHPDEMPVCDFILSVQYHRILTPAQLTRARRAAANLHMAPLPEYRGSNQFSFAILEGKAEFGTTLHLMDARIDHGPILTQRRWPIPPDCWVEDLYARTVEESVALFAEALPGLLAGEIQATPQAALEAEYGTSLHLRSEMAELKKLDLSWTAEKIERHVRATYMPGFEPPHAMVAGRKVFFTPETEAR